MFPVNVATVAPAPVTVRVISDAPPLLRMGTRQTPKFTSVHETVVIAARPALALTEADTVFAVCAWAGKADKAVKVAAKSEAFIVIFINLIPYSIYLFLNRSDMIGKIVIYN